MFTDPFPSSGCLLFKFIAYQRMLFRCLFRGRCLETGQYAIIFVQGLCAFEYFTSFLCELF
jgi:hypothetical protein